MSADRKRLKCAHPQCDFLVHADPQFGGFCCRKCEAAVNGKPKHGERCQRKPAGPWMRRHEGLASDVKDAVAQDWKAIHDLASKKDVKDAVAQDLKAVHDVERLSAQSSGQVQEGEDGSNVRAFKMFVGSDWVYALDASNANKKHGLLPAAANLMNEALDGAGQGIDRKDLHLMEPESDWHTELLSLLRSRFIGGCFELAAYRDLCVVGIASNKETRKRASNLAFALAVAHDERESGRNYSRDFQDLVGMEVKTLAASPKPPATPPPKELLVPAPPSSPPPQGKPCLLRSAEKTCHLKDSEGPMLDDSDSIAPSGPVSEDESMLIDEWGNVATEAEPATLQQDSQGGWSLPIEYDDSNFRRTIREALQRTEVAEEVMEAKPKRRPTPAKSVPRPPEELKAITESPVHMPSSSSGCSKQWNVEQQPTSAKRSKSSSDVPSALEVKEQEVTEGGVGYRQEEDEVARKKCRFTAYLPRRLYDCVVLQEVSDGMWRATNTFLQAETTGLSYRRTKSFIQNVTHIEELQWGDTIEGNDEGDDWVRVHLAKGWVTKLKSQEIVCHGPVAIEDQVPAKKMPSQSSNHKLESLLSLLRSHDLSEDEISRIRNIESMASIGDLADGATSEEDARDWATKTLGFTTRVPTNRFVKAWSAARDATKVPSPKQVPRKPVRQPPGPPPPHLLPVPPPPSEPHPEQLQWWQQKSRQADRGVYNIENVELDQVWALQDSIAPTFSGGAHAGQPLKTLIDAIVHGQVDPLSTPSLVLDVYLAKVVHKGKPVQRYFTYDHRRAWCMQKAGVTSIRARVCKNVKTLDEFIGKAWQTAGRPISHLAIRSS